MQIYELSQSISHELDFLLYSFLLGILITFFYDNIRVVRRIIPHNLFFVSIEDMIFWIAVSLLIFSLQYYENNGIFRWFSIIGSLAGMLLYKVTLSKYYIKVVEKILKILLGILYRICLFLLSPLFFTEHQLKKGIGFLIRKCRKIAVHEKNRLTFQAKLIKMTLCKHKKKTAKEEEKPKRRRKEKSV